jgi:fatty acid desaturase
MKAKSYTEIAEPAWYRVHVDRRTMKTLMRRTNWHGLAYFAGYLALLVLFGALSMLDVFPLWVRVLSFIAYANVLCFCEAILHETNHRTAFRTSWLNEAVHYVAGVLNFKEPIRDRWLHAAHHTYTSYPDIDPETFLDPPVQPWTLVLYLFRLRLVPEWLAATIHNAVRPDLLTRRFVPASDRRKVLWSSRVCVAIYALVIVASFVGQKLVADPVRLRSSLPGKPAQCVLDACPARRAGARRRRLAAEYPDSDRQSDQPLLGVEHDIPPGAPHVPDGSVPRAAAAERRDRL